MALSEKEIRLISANVLKGITNNKLKHTSLELREQDLFILQVSNIAHKYYPLLNPGAVIDLRYFF